MEDSFVDGYFIREYSLIKMGTPESTFSSLFFPSLPSHVCLHSLTTPLGCSLHGLSVGLVPRSALAKRPVCGQAEAEVWAQALQRAGRHPLRVPPIFNPSFPLIHHADFKPGARLRRQKCVWL